MIEPIKPIKPIKPTKPIKLTKLTKLIVPTIKTISTIKTIITISTIITTICFLLWPAWGFAFEATPSIAVRETYNDNIFFNADDPEEDYITTITGGLTVGQSTEILDWNVDGRVSPFYYADNDKLDEVDQSCQGQFEYRMLSWLALDGDAGYTIDNRPDRDIEETGLVQDSQERHRTTAGVGGRFDLSENLNLTLSYDYQQVDWTEDDSENIDTQEHAIVLGSVIDIGRWLRASQMTLHAGYNQFDADTNDIQSGYATIGIQSMLSEIWRLHASAGARYTQTRYEVPTLVEVAPDIFEIQDQEEETQGWGGLGRLSMTYIGERTRCSVSLFHDLRPTSGTRGPAELSQIRLDVDYRPLNRLTMGLATSYFTNTAEAEEFGAESIDEETFNIRPRLRWEIVDNFFITGAYTYTQLINKETDTDTERHLVYLQLKLSYPIND